MAGTVQSQADGEVSQLLYQFLASVEGRLALQGEPEWNPGDEIVLCVFDLAGVRYKLSSQSVSEEGSPHHTLSPREQEVIRLVMKGLSTRGIAAVLEISPWTVITHLRRIFSKLNVNSRAEMVACVLKEGALSPSSGSS